MNLDFAQANLSGYTAGVYVPIANAIPGWTGYIGTNQQTTVLYNDLAIGSAVLSLLDTNYISPAAIIPGSSDMVVIQAGFPSKPASIAQSAMIPATAKSILFAANYPYGSGWQVTIAGKIIPVTQVSAINSNYAFFEGDISTYAGHVDELRFTALYVSSPGGSLFLDSIQFSATPIPEPSSVALAALGGAWFILRRWSARRNIFPQS